ncbi:ATP-binding protein [Kribbella sp. NPDC050470]|uniref:ATP-binding protein n=1 Tax=unclassified Kribbella TaxID=2644121 RepID=UPI0037950117
MVRLNVESLGELLRRHRTGLGLTQAALAEKAGLSEQAISVLERGTRRRPRLDTVRALTTALGLDAADAADFMAVARGTGRLASATTAPSGPAASIDSLPVPWQLPPAIPDFTGRSAQLDAVLSALRDPDGSGGGAVGLVAVTGMGGIGKTALAVRAAHKLVMSYPDGQLYLNLRGYGPGKPTATADALGQLLRSLGLDVQLIPEGVEEAAALLRSQLAGRRMLMLLDNATDVHQITPLLPGSPGSAVIITSRASLAALPGARQIRLDALSETESVDLLAGVAGTDRVAAEPDAAESLTRFAGRLPLAVRLIGARLAARPGWPIQHLVDFLENEGRRLDSLGSDDTGVRASIASSVRFLESSDRELDREAALALPTLSVPDGSDLHTSVAAHLLDMPIRHAGLVLERLVDLNLLDPVAPERYRFHDLIRAYARELAEQSLTQSELDAGLGRVLRFYIGFAWACQSLTHEASQRPGLATIRIPPVPALRDTVSALRWLDDEERNLIDRFRQASATSLAGSALLPELALALFGYHEPRSRWVEMREFSRGMVELAERLDLPLMAAWLEHDTAIPMVELGDFESARAHLVKALERFRGVSDIAGQARCCSSLSHVLERLGRTEEALSMIQQALELSRQLDDRSVEGVTYLALGGLHNRLGDFAEADQAFAESIRLAEQSGDQRSLAKRYLNAGISHVANQRFDNAIESLRTSIQVSGRLGDGNGQSESKEVLTVAFAGKGEFAVAEEHAHSGIQLARAYRNRLREGRLLLQLAKIRAASEDSESARQLLTEAIPSLHAAADKVERDALDLLAVLDRDETYTYRPNYS